jgi:endogenous inhibitor of DNA gyrase (YacG/DUF329 family)
MPEASGADKKCAICGKPAQHQFRPFCSRRCADVDLHRWFSNSYAIPVVEDDEDVSTVPKSEADKDN